MWFKKSLISIISPIYFQLNHIEDCTKDSSSEAHLKSSKTKGSFLDLEVSIYV